MIVTPEGLNVFPEDVERRADEMAASANRRSSAVAHGSEEASTR